jgi:hypothetical protein
MNHSMYDQITRLEIGFPMQFPRQPTGGSAELPSNLRSIQRVKVSELIDASPVGVWFPDSIEILVCRCFDKCHQLSSISFEWDSGVIRIGSHAFSSPPLRSIVIPSTVEIIGSSCFEECESLSSIYLSQICD